MGNYPITDKGQKGDKSERVLLTAALVPTPDSNFFRCRPLLACILRIRSRKAFMSKHKIAAVEPFSKK
jgi:hypothetical protein